MFVRIKDSIVRAEDVISVDVIKCINAKSAEFIIEVKLPERFIRKKFETYSDASKYLDNLRDILNGVLV